MLPVIGPCIGGAAQDYDAGNMTMAFPVSTAARDFLVARMYENPSCANHTMPLHHYGFPPVVC